MPTQLKRLQVKLAKDHILKIVNSTNQLIQSVYEGAAQPSLFVTLFWHLLSFSTTFQFSLTVAIQAKQHINELKYPPHLNQGTIVDYKSISRKTGINKNTASEEIANLAQLGSVEPMTKEWIDRFLRQSKLFVQQRNWGKYDQPRNLSLALMEEVGELCGVLKFVDDSQQHVSCGVYGAMISEMCDVFIYFCRLTDTCGLLEAIKKEIAP